MVCGKFIYVFWLPLEICRDQTFNLLQRITYVYSISKFTKEVLNAQDTRHDQNRWLIVVHCHDFYIIIQIVLGSLWTDLSSQINIWNEAKCHGLFVIISNISLFLSLHIPMLHPLHPISLIINVYYRTSSLMTSKRYILIVLAAIIHSNIRTVLILIVMVVGFKTVYANSAYHR